MTAGWIGASFWSSARVGWAMTSGGICAAYGCRTGSTTLMWIWITDWLPDRNRVSRSGGATMTVSILRSFSRWSADAGSAATSMTFMPVATPWYVARSVGRPEPGGTTMIASSGLR